MKKFLFLRLLVGGFALTSTMARADWYGHVFPNISPYDDKQSCEAAMAQISYAYARQTGVQPSGFSCFQNQWVVDPSHAPWSGVLDYPKHPEYWMNTMESWLGFSEGLRFSNLSACETELTEQKAIFAQATGNDPVAAYCWVGNGTYRYINIEGVSDHSPTVRPDFTNNVINDVAGPIFDEQVVMNNFRAIGPAYGLVIGQAGTNVESNGLTQFNVLKLHTYLSETSRPRLRMSLDRDWLLFNSAADCKIAAADVRGFIGTTAKPVVTFCAMDESNLVRLHIADFISRDALSEPLFSGSPTTGDDWYATLSECRQSEKWWSRIPYVYKFLGGVCAIKYHVSETGTGVLGYGAYIFSRP